MIDQIGEKFMPYPTGYENKTVDMELVKDTAGYIENVGCCERCGVTESENWYIRHWLNNGLMDHTGLCQECAIGNNGAREGWEKGEL